MFIATTTKKGTNLLGACSFGISMFIATTMRKEDNAHVTRVSLLRHASLQKNETTDAICCILKCILAKF